MKHSIFKNTFIVYTVTFLLLAPIVFMPFLSDGRSFVWYIDGINQHYPILIYYGKLLRELMLGNGFSMVDFNVGMGFDTISTLHYYVLGDPISLLAIFMTQNNSVIFYNILILLRFYLIGISFLVFCRYWRLEGNGKVLGALMYVFCGYTFFSGVRHPYFLNPMIYLPLILIGLEQTLRRKKPHLLIIMTFVCTISNFYFLYILTMIAVFYVVFRYCSTFYKLAKNKLLGFLFTGLRIGGYYLLGMAMAAVVFLPVIYAFLQNGRMDSKPELLTNYLHYNKSYYLYALQGIFAAGVSPNYWVDLSYSTVTGISTVILINNKKYRKLGIAFALTLLALFVPSFGYFMNAFSYITNRWDFLVAFMVAAVFSFTYKDLFKLNNWERVLLLIGVLGYGALSFVLPSSIIVKCTFVILLITIAVVLLLQTEQLRKNKIVQEVTIYALVVITLAFNGYAFFSMHFNGYVEQFLTKEEVETQTNGGKDSMLAEIEDDDFYRIETYGDEVRNEALISGYNDVSSYFSLMDGNVTSYYKHLEMLNQRTAYRIDNQDNRTILDALASVKYFITTDKTAAPYAYELRKAKTYGSETFYLFENLYTLPLGYTYQSYMLEEDYDKLSALEKQNALMYAVILEEKSDYAKVTDQDMGIGIEKLDFDIYTDGSITFGEGSLQVKKEGAVMTLSFDNKKKSETYIRFSDLSIEKRAMVMQTLKAKGEKEVTKNVNIRNLYHNSYFGKVNFLINTGYSKGEKAWAKITFPEPETYSYGGIEVYNLDMQYYKEQVFKLKQSGLQNINQSKNRMEGDATLKEKGIMVFSIPYSIGWSAEVDGEKVKLLKANVMYSALQLSAGEHHIVLKYETPYLKEGLVISVLSFLVFVGIIVAMRGKGGSNV